MEKEAVDILNVARAQGGQTDIGQNASSNVTASILLTQTAAIQPGTVGQRVVNQVFQRQLRTR